MKFSASILDAMLSPLQQGPASLDILGINDVVLLSMDLPTPWITVPQGGMVHKAGAWQGVGVGNGRATTFVIRTPLGEIRGTVGKQMKLNNPDITVGRSLTITKFSVQLST
jgi:hypothetical protein